MKLSLVRRLAFLAYLSVFGFLLPFRASAQFGFGVNSGPTNPYSDSGSPLGISSEAHRFKTSMLTKLDASADSYEYVGDNMIALGHVVIKSGGLTITADKAIINLGSQDIEAAGNVTFTRVVRETRNIDYQEYEDYLKDPAHKVIIVGNTTLPTGRKMLKVEIESIGNYMKAGRVAGNLRTGLLQFKDFALKTGSMYVASSQAERTPDGNITAENVRMTTCDYIMDDHDHYALTASSVRMAPRKYNSGLVNYNPDHGEHEITAFNPVLRLWDVPVLWFPALYKPYETDSFGVDFEVGSSSDWGYYIRTSKAFTIIDTKKLHVNAAALFDYYQDRGPGGGGKGAILTENSRSEFFAYGMYDKEPYSQWGASDDSTIEWYRGHSRLSIPEARYDVKLTNVTHLTPRLDFRGQFELLSDYNFLYDYYYKRYSENIQPPTYAALEYQLDRFSTAILTTPRVNSFDTVVERLPEAYLNMPRQELFGGLYYQSESSLAYLDMKWREFDSRSKYGELSDYRSGRFDTLHMFYYPFNMNYLNIIPRAGFRLTGYSETSDRDISDDDLQRMFLANSIALSNRDYDFVNYDNDGGGKLRFLAEFGLQMNTKIYRSWQNVRSAFWNLDGLRHVAIPYINYTYIPDTDNYQHNYYFDDLDRIHKQHYLRFGLTNRLQTRQGHYGEEQIREWFSMDAYWDYHIESQDGFNHLGDFGTKLSFTPFEDLTLTTELIWDVGENSDHNEEAQRGIRFGGRPGLSKLKYLDKWNTTLVYRIAKDWMIYGSYYYSDSYRLRGIYSMGSMLERINATSTTLAATYSRGQMATIGLKFPTYIDPRMTAGASVTYDVDAALLNRAAFNLVRDFHCWKAGFEVGMTTTRDELGDKTISNYVSVFIALSAMPSVGTKFDQSR